MKQVTFFKQLNFGKMAKKAMGMSPDEIINEIGRSRLQGRGKKGYLVSDKMRVVKASQRPQKYIICNISEGQPCSTKDLMIISNEDLCKKMLLGLFICAKVVGTSKAFFMLRYEYKIYKKQLKRFIELTQALHPSFSEVAYEIRLQAAYISGEETTTIEILEGRAARPKTDKTKFPAENGLFDCPTQVNNTETFLCVPLILHYGFEKWNAVCGLDKEQAGLKMYNIAGDVDKNIVIESPVGERLSEILKDCNVNLNQIGAAEVGGEAQWIILKEDFDHIVGFNRRQQNLLGTGSIVLMHEKRDLKKIYLDKLLYMKAVSCKQCVPCKIGTKKLFKAGNDMLGRFDAVASSEQLLDLDLSNLKLYDGYEQEAIDMIVDAVAYTSNCGHGYELSVLYRGFVQHVKRMYEKKQVAKCLNANPIGAKNTNKPQKNRGALRNALSHRQQNQIQTQNQYFNVGNRRLRRVDDSFTLF